MLLPSGNPKMKLFKHPNPVKAITSFVLLGALLFASPVFAHFYSPTEEATLVSLVTDSHNHVRAHSPVQQQSAEPQCETELKVEEEDSTEKSAHLATEFFYDFSRTWTTNAACSNRALSRMAGVNGLYILHHSWKSFLV